MSAAWLGLVAAAGAAEWVVGVDAPTAQATVDLAAEGDTVRLPEGTWRGPVVLDRRITLAGAGGVLDGGDLGTVLTVVAPGTVVDGVRVRGSGTELTGLTPDACVRTTALATGAVIRNVEAWDCTFGIWVHETRGAQVVDNRVTGRPEPRPSERGNGVHLFDGSQLVVRGNTVAGTRDGIYVSATDDSLIADNVASEVRYGIHYMYSQRNEVRGNHTHRCSGGIALMQSSHLTVIGNDASDNVQKGILFRDVQYSTIQGNRVERNAEGLFFFSSLDNLIADNLVKGNDVGARIWAGSERNVVRGNRFVGNRQQVFYVAAEDQIWGDEHAGNTWSDYLGWDQDGDGRGDRPYRADSFVASLLFEYPQAVLLLSSPSLEMLRYLEERMPALRAPTVIDPHPTLVQAEAP